MPSFDVDAQPVYIFALGDEYVFKQYFEQNDVFDALEEYYQSDEYRFEVPPEELDAVMETLEEYFFEPVVVEDVDEFCVVKEQYTEHAEILRNAVVKWQRRGYNFFLMKDPRSVDQALEHGATRIEETDLEVGL
jgi:hypothetical protein